MNNPRKVEKYMWEPTTGPMQLVHVDFAGPFLGHIFFVLIDAYSKWFEIHTMKDSNAKSTINKCEEIFAAYGMPLLLVSDNGTTFTSTEFATFLESQGIAHKRTAPYNPSTNGQAEQFVQSFKQSLRKMNTTRTDVHLKLQRFLAQYRATPHIGNKTSAELFLGRKLRNVLDLLKPTTSSIVKHNPNENTIFKRFTRDDRVSCRNYTNKVTWRFGRIARALGNLQYKIRLDDGRTWTRHANQLREIAKQRHYKIKTRTTWRTIMSLLRTSRNGTEETLQPATTSTQTHENDATRAVSASKIVCDTEPSTK